MPREYNIRWTANQRKRLDQAARAYNRAVRKAAKENPELAPMLPSEVKFSKLKEDITTARTLNNTVNRLNRASRPDAMKFVRQADGSVVTRYEQHEFAVLRSVRERRKSMEAKKRGVVQPRSGAGTLDQARLSPDRRKVKSLSADSIRRFIETQTKEQSLSKRDRAERYYTNYYAALDNVFGGYAEHDAAVARIKEIIEKAADKDLDKLIEFLDEAREIKYIYYAYEREVKIAAILEAWEKFAREVGV